MIINNQKINSTVIDGESNVKTAKIDQTRIHKLQYILTEGLYQDAVSAVITELSNNAVDSIVESGKDPIKNPVLVKLFQEGNKYKLSIEDKGLGMSKEFFEDSFMSILFSTKEDNNDTIGSFGIGGKSWASLKRPAYFTVVKDGRKSKFLCYKGEEFIDYDPIIDNVDTTEENGVLFEMDIHSYWEFNDFCTKARRQLSYYDTVVLIINGQIHTNKIYRGELFQFCSQSPYPHIHFSLKDVVYPLAYDKLGISPIALPICLKFSLEDGIIPSPSRESVLYSRETIQLIKDRISAVAKHLVEVYNKDIKEFQTFKDAYPHIGSPYKNIVIEGHTLSLNPILSQTTLKTEEVNVKGFNSKHLEHLKRQLNYIGARWENVGRIDYKGLFSTRNRYGSLYAQNNDKAIWVDSVPVGNLREYLKEHYKDISIYKCRGEMKLYSKTETGLIAQSVEARSLSYHSQLYLHGINKSLWREYIQEAKLIQKEYEANLIDFRNFTIPQSWLDARKTKRKANGKSKTLDKADGDITYNFFRNKQYDGRMLDKKTKKISELSKMKHMVIYFTMKDKEKAVMLDAVLQKTKHAVCILNEREIKHAGGIHQFKSYKEFMETSLFKKFATAQLLTSVMEKYSHFTKAAMYDDMLKVVEQNHYDEYMAFKKYYDEYNVLVDDDLGKEICEIAEKNNWYDLEMMAIMKRVEKTMDKYSFLQFFKLPVIEKYDTVEQIDAKQSAFRKLVHEFIYNRKMYKNEFEEFDICVKAKEETPTVLEEDEKVMAAIDAIELV